MKVKISRMQKEGWGRDLNVKNLQLKKKICNFVIIFMKYLERPESGVYNCYLEKYRNVKKYYY